MPSLKKISVILRFNSAAASPIGRRAGPAGGITVMRHETQTDGSDPTASLPD